MEKVIEKERPDGIMLAFGGQTALNCGVELLHLDFHERFLVRFQSKKSQLRTGNLIRCLFFLGNNRACQYKIPNYGGNFDASGRTDGPLNAPRASAAPLPRSLPKRASPRR